MVILFKVDHKTKRETLRTFIAIDLTDGILQKIVSITSYLKTQVPSNAIKWVSEGNLHLTLKFLGEIPESKLEQIKTLSRKAVHEIHSLIFSVEGLGMYPNHKNPRVIWLGIFNEKPLVKLAAQIDQALYEAGIPREKRPFSPHLTIGRVRRSASHDEIIKIGAVLSQFKVDCLGEMPVEKVRLYQSELKPRGPIYTPLFDIPLNKV